MRLPLGRTWILLAGPTLIVAAAAAAALGARAHHPRGGGAATPASANVVAVASPIALRPRAVEPQAGVEPATASTGGPTESEPSAAAAARADSLPQPESDAQIRRDLKAAGLSAGGRASVTPDGLAVAPLDAPGVVQKIISAGDQIARLPYRYGGGHRTWVDTAYDCSGSVSFALAAAGLVTSPLDSTSLARWGDPGPGRWVTVYANGGHAWMTVAGLRFDTSGHGPGGSRWQSAARTTAGFTLRHPPGL
jgi:cell wall-associated NlpC family hydrolase